MNNKEIKASLVDAIRDELGGGTADNEPFHVNVEVADLMIEVSGHFWADGYCEDDYFNGTGGWVTTGATVAIDSLVAYDQEGDDVELNLDESLIEREIEDEIKTI